MWRMNLSLCSLMHASVRYSASLIRICSPHEFYPDYMTSTLSTVPYNQEQCEAYLRLIRTLPDSERAEGYRNCVLARLWSEIDGNFFVNLRGEETPRLSRFQRLLPEPNIRVTKILSFLKGYMFLGSSETYEGTLSEMWVDKISYASHWRKFIGGMVSEWKMHAVWVRFILWLDMRHRSHCDFAVL